MKRMGLLTLIAVIIISIFSFQKNKKFKQQNQKDSYIPANGFVPDSATAIKIAEAIWVPIYGTSVLEEKPYTVILEKDSIWIVDGTLKEGWLGGTAHIEIQKKDCKILNVIHGK